jgi:hypothetical protein
MAFSASTKEGCSMTSFPRRWINAAMVLIQERSVSRHARETQQSRETIYRDFRRVSHELQEGQQLRVELERRNQELAAENAHLQKVATSRFEDPDKVAQFAAMAQAEGVSLPVARRLLAILQAKPTCRR